MKTRQGSRGTLLLLAAMIVALAACAKNPYIQVTYMPPPAGVASGAAVFLSVKDARTDKTVLNDAAQPYFKDFSGRYLLFLDHGDKQVETLGGYDLAALIAEAFKKRLERLGISVTPARKENVAVLEIAVQRFNLALEDKTWKAALSYDLKLHGKKGAYVGESVAASAERIRIMGRKEADRVVSEMVSDGVNRPDLIELFKRLESIR